MEAGVNCVRLQCKQVAYLTAINNESLARKLVGDGSLRNVLSQL